MTPEARAKEVLDKIFGHSRAHGRGELRSVTEAIREATRDHASAEDIVGPV